MTAGGIRWPSLLLAVGLSFAACSGGGPAAKRMTPTPRREPAPPVTIAAGAAMKIGVSVPLSGDQASLGWDLAAAVELAVRDHGEQIAKHRVTVSWMDDGCADAQQASSVARALTADPSVVGVIGPMCTTGAQAADSIYDAAGIVHILPTATRADLSQQGEAYFFRTAWVDEAQARTQAQYARATASVETVLLIDDGEPYGKALADAFATAFNHAGGTIASRERIKRGDTEFSTLARKAKTAGAEAVVYEGLSPEGPLLARALREGGYDGRFIAPDALFSQHDFIDALRSRTDPSRAEGAIVTGGPKPDDAFVAKFQAAQQRAPSTPFVLQAYDATTALLAAITEAGATQADGSLVIEPDALAERLRAQTSQGLTGTIRFNERGDRSGESPREAGLAVYVVRDGKFERQDD